MSRMDAGCSTPMSPTGPVGAGPVVVGTVVEGAVLGGTVVGGDDDDGAGAVVVAPGGKELVGIGAVVGLVGAGVVGLGALDVTDGAAVVSVPGADAVVAVVAVTFVVAISSSEHPPTIPTNCITITVRATRALMGRGYGRPRRRCIGTGCRDGRPWRLGI